MKPSMLLLAAVVCACGPKTETAPPVETPVLPEAHTLYDRFLEVTNAQESLVGVESMSMRSEMRIPAAGIAGEVVAYWKTGTDSSSAKVLVEQNIPGIGSGRVGFDGETGWSSDNMMGPRLINGRELDELLWDSQIDSEIKYKDWYSKLETKAQVQFRGEDAWQVEATTKHDRVDTKYFSIESGLMLGSAYEVESPLGPMTMEMHHSEWAEMDGLWVPKISLISTGPVEMETEIIELNKNPELDETLFDLPAEIEELLADQKEKEAENESEEQDSIEAPESTEQEADQEQP
mgnify:CR=1 FL=1